ncbi:MAG: putative transcriptional regulator [Haloquadratum sp. J07HQX50]|nr:MAG: putative transcriptional regulator [Haloquadratum sp. J07HQX50]
MKADLKSDYRNRLIAELYETEKLTQTEVADAVGLTQPAVNQILKNRSISIINKFNEGIK